MEVSSVLLVGQVAETEHVGPAPIAVGELLAVRVVREHEAAGGVEVVDVLADHLDVARRPKSSWRRPGP
jgi:hypothetical protein